MLDASVVLSDGTVIEYRAINFLSWINGDTYGRPAIVAPGEDHQPGEQTVLFVNTALVAAVKVDKSQ